MEIRQDKLILLSDTKRLGLINPKLYIPFDMMFIRDEVIRYGDQYYHIKPVNIHQLINELIGSYLCKRVNLDAVDYKICTNGKIYYVISKLFYDKDYRFWYASDLCTDTIPDSESIVKGKDPFTLFSKDFKEATLYDFFKLIAVDLKMGQKDRHKGNIMFKEHKKNRVFSLAPAFDFGISYSKKPTHIYFTPFVVIKRDEEIIRNIVMRHPEFKDIIDIMKRIKMDDILDDISSLYGIKFDEKEINYYRNKDKEYSKIIKGI